MSAVPAVAGTDAAANTIPLPFPATEYLHLHLVRVHWATKFHKDLGPHLQDALDVLAREGWDVVTSYCVVQTPEIILKRTKSISN